MANYFPPVWTILCCTLILVRCSKTPDLEAAKQQLLQLHYAQKSAHLEENAKRFVSQFDKDMVMINRGKISTSSLEQAEARVQAYFDDVEFKQWEDLQPPQISFSDDASMAYMVVDKSVVLTHLNERQETIEESTHFAWVSIFKKQASGEWKIVCNVSTNEPAVERAVSPAN